MDTTKQGLTNQKEFDSDRPSSDRQGGLEPRSEATGSVQISLSAQKQYFGQPHVLRHLSITVDGARVDEKSQMFGAVGGADGIAGWMVNTVVLKSLNGHETRPWRNPFGSEILLW